MECINLNVILRRENKKKSYGCTDYEVVGGKQKFNTARTKLSPSFMQ